MKKKLKLTCAECGETCGAKKGCKLYHPKDDPHVHLPGGLKTYGLCAPCEEKCLEIHRPIAADGTWKWVTEGCSDAACGYCKALDAELKRIGVRPGSSGGSGPPSGTGRAPS